MGQHGGAAARSRATLAPSSSSSSCSLHCSTLRADPSGGMAVAAACRGTPRALVLLAAGAEEIETVSIVDVLRRATVRRRARPLHWAHRPRRRAPSRSKPWSPALAAPARSSAAAASFCSRTWRCPTQRLVARVLRGREPADAAMASADGAADASRAGHVRPGRAAGRCKGRRGAGIGSGPRRRMMRPAAADDGDPRRATQSAPSCASKSVLDAGSRPSAPVSRRYGRRQPWLCMTAMSGALMVAGDADADEWTEYADDDGAAERADPLRRHAGAVTQHPSRWHGTASQPAAGSPRTRRCATCWSRPATRTPRTASWWTAA